MSWKETKSDDDESIEKMDNIVTEFSLSCVDVREEREREREMNYESRSCVRGADAEKWGAER